MGGKKKRKKKKTTKSWMLTGLLQGPFLSYHQGWVRENVLSKPCCLERPQGARSQLPTHPPLPRPPCCRPGPEVVLGEPHRISNSKSYPVSGGGFNPCSFWVERRGFPLHGEPCFRLLTMSVSTVTQRSTDKTQRCCQAQTSPFGPPCYLQYFLS